MCGLIGIINNERTIPPKLLKTFTQLLTSSVVRGYDSTGLFGIDEAGEIDVYKKALTSPDFVQTDMYAKFSKRFKDYRFIAGHVRASTRGATNDRNAHPFTHGNITLMQNGTLDYHSALIKDKKVSFQVDSEALTYAFNESGEEEILKEVEGALALVWYNSNDYTFNIIRNKERPLSIVKIKDKDILIYASEAKMLRWLLYRNDFEIEYQEELKVGRWLSYKDTVEKPYKDREIKLKTSYWDTYYDSNYQAYYKHNSAKTYMSKIPGLKSNIFIDLIYESHTISARDKTTKEPKACKVEGYYKYYSYKKLKKIPFVSYGTPYKEIKDLKIGSPLTGKVVNAIKNTTSFHKDYEFYLIILNLTKTTNIVPIKTYIGPRGVYVDEGKWDELTLHGCCKCQGNVHKEDDQFTLWYKSDIGTDEPICKECNFEDSYVEDNYVREDRNYYV
jgi:glucosamine 6-phosphate synthetase-like amidotransferase/phosphosugar isomerase protein